MCGSPKIDTTYQDFQMDEAKRARAEEDARQARIDEGMKQIAAVFEGGSYAPYMGGLEATNAVDPVKQAAYEEQMAKWNEAAQSSASGDVLSQMFSLALRPRAPTAEWRISDPGERGEAVNYEGMAPLLQQREQAQRDFYMPQLDKQASKASENLTFALARAGLLNSTTAGQRQGDLSEQFGLERGALLSRIASDIAGTQTRINQQRNSIEAGLRASGDQTAAANQALQSAVTFRQDQPQLDPLGNLFYGISEGIGAAKTGEEVRRIKEMSRSPYATSNAGRLVGA